MSDADSAAADRRSSFRSWRRRVVEQIIFCKELSPLARVTAYAVANLLNRETRSTFASSMTVGQQVGLGPDEVANGLTELVKAGQVQVKRRENGRRDVFLVYRKDIESPYMPVRADSQFFRTPEWRLFLAERARFLDTIFADQNLSPTDKVIAFGASRLIMVEYRLILATYKKIGEVVGYSRETAKLAIGRLIRAGYFEKKNVDRKTMALFPMLEGKRAGKPVGNRAGKTNLRSAGLTGASSPNPGTPGIPGAILSYRQHQSASPPDAERDGLSALVGDGLPASVILDAEVSFAPKVADEGAMSSGSASPEAAIAARDCYALVRQHYGEGRVGLVARALMEMLPEEVYRRITEAIEDENDLGHVLWVP
jgi:hypothetical protein